MWILLALILGIADAAKTSYDAKYHPYKQPKCFELKPWEKERIEEYKRNHRK